MAVARDVQVATGDDRPTPGPTQRTSPPRPSAQHGSSSAFGWQDGAAPGVSGTEHTLPGLHGEERLPWLNAEDDAEAGLDPGRVWAVVLIGFALLLLIVGGVWWTMHRRDANTQLADGSLITAPPGPIKVAPQDAGGKTFDGTGDSSFTVSQGHVPGATLAGDDQADGGAAAEVIPPAATTAGAIAGKSNPVGPTSGRSPGAIAVQLGAFSTQSAAEAAWAHVSKAYDALSGSTHRIVTGNADIGTVYDLQAVVANDAAANALCDRLKAAGLNCQVKD